MIRVLKNSSEMISWAVGIQAVSGKVVEDRTGEGLDRVVSGEDFDVLNRGEARRSQQNSRYKGRYNDSMSPFSHFGLVGK